MPDTLTPQEFASAIKAKYPQYANLPDDVLVTKMLGKYPEYRDVVKVAPMNTALVNGKPVTMPPDVAEQFRRAQDPNAGGGDMLVDNAKNIGRVVTDWLPAIGGAAGGAAGLAAGPIGAAAGAGLGGAAGQGVKTIVQRIGHAFQSGDYTTPVNLPQTATDMAKQGAIQAAFEGGGQALGLGLGAGGKAVYRGYLKPSLAEDMLPKAAEIVDTAMKEALPISAGGVEKARGLIADLNKQVNAELATNPGKVDLHQVAERVRAFAKGKYYTPGVPSADYDAALKVADSIDKHASLGLPAGAQPTRVEVGLPAAQQIKHGLQRSGADASLLDRAATSQTQQAGGHEMRTAIEQVAPNVAPLNARESKLIPAAQAIAKAVEREANQSKTYGVKAIVGTALGSEEYTRTGNPYVAAAKGLALTLGLQPGVASRLAIVASRLGDVSGAIPANVARIALQAVLQGQPKNNADGGPPEQ